MENEEVQYYKRNPLLSPMGGFAWGSIIVAPLVVVFAGADWDFAFTMFVVFFIISFLPISFTLNYFGVGQYHFEVRNYHFFWRREKYYYDEIERVVFNHKGQSYKCITIYMKDGRQKTWVGSSQSVRYWYDVKQALISRNVTMKDELGLDESVTPRATMFRRIFFTGFIISGAISGALTLLMTEYVSEDQWAIRLVIVLLLLVGNLVAIGLISRYASRKSTEEEERQKNNGL